MARNFVRASSQQLNVNTAAVAGWPVSVAAWVRCADITNGHNIVSIGDKDSTTQYWSLVCAGNFSGDPIRMLAVSGGAVAIADTTAAYSANTWQHVCGVSSASNSWAAYVNGGNKGTSSTTASITGHDATRIGMYVNASPFNYFDGDIAEVAIWAATLTDSEVALLSKGVSPLAVQPASLAFYAPLIGKHSSEIDIVGGLALTVTGATAAAHPRVFYPPTGLWTPKGAAGGGGPSAMPWLYRSHTQTLGAGFQRGAL